MESIGEEIALVHSYNRKKLNGLGTSRKETHYTKNGYGG